MREDGVEGQTVNECRDEPVQLHDSTNTDNVAEGSETATQGHAGSHSIVFVTDIEFCRSLRGIYDIVAASG